MRCLLAATLLCSAAARAGDEYVIPAEQKGHWAWKTPVRPELPAVKNAVWVKNPIDRFVLARLEAAGLKPARPASREQLIRRATFDLIGLPPTPAEVDEFLTESEEAPQAAYEKLIDRLLASPHYGERWGRHWLDLARYAESNGYEFDEVRPNAWRYRDYVIRAFNDDKPYDRFIREQLAGDELDPDDPQALTATGFNLLGPDMTDSSDKAQRRQNTLNDMTDTAGFVFLGLTLGCARCHDHKFEPIPQSDYYRLQAFFTPVVFRNDVPVADKKDRPALDTALREFNRVHQPLQDALTKLEAPYRTRLREAKLARLPEEAQQAHRTPADQRTGAQIELVNTTARLVNVSAMEVQNQMPAEEKTRYRELQAEIKALDGKRPNLPTAMGVQNPAGPIPKTFVLRRGELSNPVEEVVPGYPVVISPGQRPTPATIESGRRSALADWLTSKDNPLTGRVLVNRVWQHHFGRGIVPTASDFGVHGEPPTHPELLDWLAREFVDGGGRIKALHKLMLTSATYQQSSIAAPETVKGDPDNRLFSRMNRVRLEGEVIRDSLLAVSGRLNPKLGGPGVFPPVPSEVLKGAKGWTVSADKQDHVRRSVYIFARRNLRFPFLEAFDLPDSNLSCPKRERSTTAPQALALLNAADVVEAADALANRVANSESTQREQLALAYRLTLGRRPTAEEAEIAGKFLERSPLKELCRALFNLNEFVYVD